MRGASDGGGCGPEGELAARLRVVIGRLHRRLARRSVGGLTPSQLSMLVTIEQYGPLRLGDIAAREGAAPPTVTRIVAALEERGLTAREADPDDRRASLVAISSDGRALLEQIRRERTAYLARRLDALDDGSRRRLAEALSILEQLVGPPDG